MMKNYCSIISYPLCISSNAKLFLWLKEIYKEKYWVPNVTPCNLLRYKSANPFTIYGKPNLAQPLTHKLLHKNIPTKHPGCLPPTKMVIYKRLSKYIDQYVKSLYSTR